MIHWHYEDFHLFQKSKNLNKKSQMVNFKWTFQNLQNVGFNYQEILG